MAVIQKIRDKSWLLLVLIGLAMLLFVVDPSNFNPRSSNNTKIAEIDGQSIEYDAYYAKLSDIEEFNKIQRGVNSLDESVMAPIRHQAVDDLIQESIMNKEVKKLGLAVHGDELFDMVQGRNIHPIVQNIFANPETGVVNKGQLYNFLQAIVEEEDSQQKTFWIFIEKVIYKSRLNEKYNTLISKGLYATNLEAQQKHIENTSSADFSYVVKPYSSVSDTAVSVSEQEIKKYYAENKEAYKTTETRNLRYVIIDVVPSEDDYTDADKWINDVKDELKTIPVKDAPQYINYNSDKKYDNTNYAKGELTDSLDIFAFNSEIGDIYGPYFEEGAFKLVMLTSKKLISDSVKIRHILMPVNQQNAQQVVALSDSLLKELKSGSDFKAMASEFSQDRQTAELGGDLGWMTEKDITSQFGQAFHDSCFSNPKGYIFRAYSQYGVQLIEITNQSPKIEKVQVGEIVRTVTPGSETEQKYYSIASEFAGRNNTKEAFNKAAKEDGMNVRFARNISQTSQNVTGIEGSREIVRWAYTAKTGEVSSVFQLNEQYVIAVLDEVVDNGYKSFESVEATIKLALIKEKKADKISNEVSSALASASSIDAVANELHQSVKSASDIRLRTNFLPEAGEEKEVIGAVFASNEGLLAKPIKGRNGVYVVSVDQITPGDQTAFLNEKRTLNNVYSSQVNYTVTSVLKDLSGVKDYRTKFF